VGRAKKAFDSVLYAIAIMAVLFFVSMLFGFGSKFGFVFSFPGFVVMFFLVFCVLAE